jgi:hypothetical protein
MKIKYLIVSESFNETLANFDISINQQLQNFLQVLKMLSSDESVSYSGDLFNQIIFDGQPLAEWLYSGGEMRDEKRLFQLMFRRMQEEEKQLIQESIDRLQRGIYQDQSTLLMFYKFTIPQVKENLIILNHEDCLNARRFYLQLVDDFSVFLTECINCFPHLYINNRVHQTIKKLKPLKDYIGEIILHLTALNDYGKQLFLEYQDQNETVVLRHLAAIGNIHCSPQGDPVYEKKNLCFDFPSDKGGIIKIICAPHTKLFKRHSGERIYFNWGHADVKNGDKLLIGHIGEHL